MARKDRDPGGGGRRDHGLGPVVGQLLDRVATDVTAHTFPDCGHVVPEEQPGRLTALLLALPADDPAPTRGRHAMTDPAPAIPDDDPKRELVVTDPDSPDVLHISLAGDTYSMLITGDRTAGRYCLIDMHVPDGGGPPLHRHDFEEMFTVLDGSVDFFFRGATTTVSAGSTVNIPANAPHHFRNNSGRPVRMLCMCTPAGQDEYFIRCGDRVDDRTAPPPELDAQEQDERRRRALDLAARYATELLPDDGR